MAENASERDRALLLDMLNAALDAEDFVNDLDEGEFLGSRLHQNAVIRSLEIIGEAANKVSPEFCERHPEIVWRRIIGLRHRLVHGYGDVRMELVWDVVQNHVPELIEVLSPWFDDV